MLQLSTLHLSSPLRLSTSKCPPKQQGQPNAENEAGESGVTQRTHPNQSNSHVRSIDWLSRLHPEQTMVTCTPFECCSINRSSIKYHTAAVQAQKLKIRRTRGNNATILEAAAAVETQPTTTTSRLSSYQQASPQRPPYLTDRLLCQTGSRRSCLPRRSAG